MKRGRLKRHSNRLKRAIRAGMLKAECKGRYYVERADVDALVAR